MNKLERDYSQLLELRKHSGEIDWWVYDGIRLRLTADDKAFYTPDFTVMLADGTLEIHETKGHWEQAALLRIKFAADKFPFRFIAIGKCTQKEGGGWWSRTFGGME